MIALTSLLRPLDLEGRRPILDQAIASVLLDVVRGMMRVGMRHRLPPTIMPNTITASGRIMARLPISRRAMLIPRMASPRAIKRRPLLRPMTILPRRPIVARHPLPPRTTMAPRPIMLVLRVSRLMVNLAIPSNSNSINTAILRSSSSNRSSNSSSIIPPNMASLRPTIMILLIIMVALRLLIIRNKRPSLMFPLSRAAILVLLLLLLLLLMAAIRDQIIRLPRPQTRLLMETFRILGLRILMSAKLINRLHQILQLISNHLKKFLLPAPLLENVLPFGLTSFNHRILGINNF